MGSLRGFYSRQALFQKQLRQLELSKLVPKNELKEQQVCTRGGIRTPQVRHTLSEEKRTNQGETPKCQESRSIAMS